MADDSDLTLPEIDAKLASNPTVGKPDWTLEDNPDPVEATRRMQDLLYTHAAAGRTWDETAAQFKQRFPGVDPDSEKDKFPQYGHEAKLDIARYKAGREEVSPLGGPVGRSYAGVVPFLSTGIKVAENTGYGRARKRFEAGDPEPGDYQTIARYERDRAQDADFRSTWGGTLAHTALQLPGMVGEFAGGGLLFKGAAKLAPKALGWLAPETVEAASLLSARGAAQGLGRLGATTAAVPSLYAEHAVQNNIAAGRDPLDPRGVPTALGLGMAQMATLGAVAKVTGIPFQGEGMGQTLGRVGIQFVTGPFAQAATDVVTSAVGLDTGYGTLGEMARGQRGEALKQATAQAFQFAAFGLSHEAGRAEKPDPVVGAYHEALQKMAGRGLSRDAAGQALMQPADVLRSLTHKNPSPTRAEVTEAMKALPEGPVRDWGMAISETIPEAPAEAPAAPPASARSQPAQQPVPPPVAAPAAPGPSPWPPERIETMRQVLKAVGMNSAKWPPEKIVAEAQRLGLDKAEERLPEPPPPQKAASYDEPPQAPELRNESVTEPAEFARNRLVSTGRTKLLHARLRDGSVVPIGAASAIGGDFIEAGKDGGLVASNVIDAWLDRSGNVLWERSKPSPAQPPAEPPAPMDRVARMRAKQPQAPVGEQPAGPAAAQVEPQGPRKVTMEEPAKIDEFEGLSEIERHVMNRRRNFESFRDIARDAPKPGGGNYTWQGIKEIEKRAQAKLGQPGTVAQENVRKAEARKEALVNAPADAESEGKPEKRKDLVEPGSEEDAALPRHKQKQLLEDALDDHLFEIEVEIAQQLKDGKITQEEANEHGQRLKQLIGQREQTSQFRAQLRDFEKALRSGHEGAVQAGPAVPPPEATVQPAAAHAESEPAAAEPQTARNKLKPKSILDLVQRAGGIKKSAAEAHGWDVGMMTHKESGIHGIFQGREKGRLLPGRRDPSELADELRAAGHLRWDDASEHGHEVLRQAILNRATIMDKAAEEALARTEKEYQDGLEEARRSGFSAQVATEALRLGEEAGQAEGPSGDIEESHERLAIQGEHDAFPDDPNTDPWSFGQPVTPEEERGLPGGGQENATGARPQRLTALANAQIDKERIKNQLPPILARARLANPEVWDEAMLKLDRDPAAGQKLVEELAKKTRATTVQENALLLQRKVALANEHRRAMLDVLKASRDKADAITMAAAEKHEQDLFKQIDQLDQVARSTGTEWGRAGQFRKQLAAEDFSLVGMLQQAAAAKGRELTPQERQQIAILQARIAELQEKVTAAEGRLGAEAGAVKTGSQLADSPTFKEYQKTVAEAEAAKGLFKSAVAGDRLKQRGVVDRFLDWLLQWRQAFLISSPKTMGKIAMASGERIGITPAEEAVGSALGQVPGLSKIAALAPREGRGFSPAVEQRAFMGAFTDGMRDSWQTLRTGKSELDVKYGPEPLPRTWAGLVGEWHAAAKAPAVRAEFTRSFLHRVDFSLARGEDVTNPAVLTRIGLEAYKDSQAAKFQQDNRVVDAWKRAISTLSSPDASAGSRGIAFGMKLAVPIVRIPTNLVAEAITYATGSVTGSIRAGHALAKGVEKLTPEQADLIMKQLKKGSLGAAVLALGYFNPNLVGGYYQPGDERDRKKVKAGGIRTPIGDVPSWALHNPLLEVLQVGATVRRVADSFSKKSGGDPKGLGEGVFAAAAGLGEEVPFVREATDLGKTLDPRDRGHMLGEFAKSLAVPQFLQWMAGRSDIDKTTGEPVKRKPRSTWQAIETGIPGLRQRVPVKAR